MVDYPTIRGQRYSFCSIELAIVTETGGSQVYADITDLSYSDSIERAFQYGTNPAPLGRTRGVYNPGDASLTMALQAAYALIGQLGNGYMEKDINIVAKYADEGLPLIVDTLQKCRMGGLENTFSQGPDALMVTIPLQPFNVLRNGFTALNNQIT